MTETGVTTGVLAPPAARMRPRHWAGHAGCIATVIVFDLWLRLWVLPRYRRNPAGRIAAINRAVHGWGITLFNIARRSTHLRVLVEGEAPASGRYLVVANHQSSLDIPLLISLLRSLNLKFVAMEELRKGKPVISMVLRHGGSVFVGKKNMGEDLAALGRFARELPTYDGSPVIFPAGRLARDGAILPFHLAGLEAVRRVARLPILPVVIEGFWRTPSIGSFHNLDGGTVRIRIRPPIATEAVDRDPRQAYALMEDTMRRDLDELRAATD